VYPDIVLSVADEDTSKARAATPRKSRTDKLSQELETFIASTFTALAELNTSLRDLRTLTSEEGYAIRSRLNALDQRLTRLERSTADSRGRAQSKPARSKPAAGSPAPTGKEDGEEAGR
jgi:hypothetical protein